MTTDKDENPWIPHNGGPCPIPDAKAGEYEVADIEGPWYPSSLAAINLLSWKTITAYRRRERGPSTDDLLRQAIEALRELTVACVEDFGDGEDYGDGDEPVGGGRKEDGTPDPMAVTFGHIRKARAVLTAYDKREPRASPQPSATRSQIDE